LMDTGRAAGVAMGNCVPSNISVKAIVKIQERPDVPIEGVIHSLSHDPEAVNGKVTDRIQSVPNLQAVLAPGSAIEDVCGIGKGIECRANEKVVDHVCVACPGGKTSNGGDDASGTDTTCEFFGNTSLTAHVSAGATAIEVGNQAGFSLGQTVDIDPGTAVHENNIIKEVGSMFFKKQLKFDHPAGARIVGQDDEDDECSKYQYLGHLAVHICRSSYKKHYPGQVDKCMECGVFCNCDGSDGCVACHEMCMEEA